MADSRDLNFEVMDQLIDGGMEAKALLDSLIRSMDSYEVNDQLAFIVRTSELEELLDPDTLKELEKYEKE